MSKLSHSLAHVQRRDALFNQLSTLCNDYSDLTDYEISHVLCLYAHSINSPVVLKKRKRTPHRVEEVNTWEQQQG